MQDAKEVFKNTISQIFSPLQALPSLREIKFQLGYSTFSVASW